MNKNDKKTSKKTTVSELPATVEDAMNVAAEESAEEYPITNVFYNTFTFIFGGPNKTDVKNRQTGVPPKY